jgi:hypothetical protein
MFEKLIKEDYKVISSSLHITWETRSGYSRNHNSFKLNNHLTFKSERGIPFLQLLSLQSGAMCQAGAEVFSPNIECRMNAEGSVDYILLPGPSAAPSVT